MITDLNNTNVNTRRVVGVQGARILSEKVQEFEKEFCSLLLNKSIVWLSLAEPVTSNSPQLTYGTQIQTSEKAEMIVNFFEETLQYINTKGDRWNEKGREVFLRQINFFIDRELPINFVLPAFPFKSGNHEYKTLGPMPDKGEELALELINKFCEQIELIYQHGVVFNIVSDWRIFADLFHISEEKIDDYDGALRKKYPSLTKHITFFDLDYFLQTGGKHDEARDKVMKLFGKSSEKIEKKIHEDPDYRKMYLGFCRFIFEDLYLTLDEEQNSSEYLEKNKRKDSLGASLNLSLTKIRSEAHKLAKKVMRRNDADSTMIQNIFPLFIRLSIHAHDNSGPKFAIRLLSPDKVSDTLVGDKFMHIPTPWHNVVVEDSNGKFMLMKKYKIKHLDGNYELVYDSEGSPSHYKNIE